MTKYEEKAKEIIGKFNFIHNKELKEYIIYQSLEESKRCALILVDEILIELEYIDDSAMVPYEYWVEVKKEIQKL